MIRTEINVLFLQIENLKSQSLTTLRSEARKTRKTVKKLIYSLIDFDDEVMRVLDSELIFDYSGEGGGGNNDDNNDDIVVNNALYSSFFTLSAPIPVKTILVISCLFILFTKRKSSKSSFLYFSL